MSMVAIRAGIIAIGIVQSGFLPKNGTNHPRSLGRVGFNSCGTCNFGVSNFKYAFHADINTIAIKTAKSPRIVRT